jgi:hypothetical protein
MSAGKVVPWSYSSLTAFEQCPRRFKLTRITREVKETQGPQLVEGNAVHKALELYVGGKDSLPAKYLPFKPIADKLKCAPGEKLLEYSFGLTKQLTPTTFFGSDVWVRGKLDVTILRGANAAVFDYKNGKRKLDLDQLKLFAAAGFHSWPQVQRVDTAYIWLTEGKLDKETFVREDAVGIWQEFAIRVHRMERAAERDEFPPKPSGLCKQYCPVGKSLCEYCGV